MAKLITLLLFISIFNSAFAEQKTIGFISDISGFNVESGESCKHGYELAVDNSHKIVRSNLNFQFEDSQSSPRFALNAYQKLNNQSDMLAVAVFSSPNALSVNPFSLKEQIPMLALAGNMQVTNDNKYAFSSWMSSENEGSNIAKEIFKQGLKSVAIVSTENDYMLDVAKHFKNTSHQIDLKIVSDNTVLHDLMDFRGLINRMLSKNPETFFINLHTGTAPAFVKQLRQAGFKGTFFGNFYLSRENEISAAGNDNAEGGQVLTIKLDNPKYLQAYLNKFNQNGSVLDYACFVGASHLLQSVEFLLNEKLELTTQNLHLQMLKLKKVQIFDQEIAVINRWFDYSYELKVIKDGKLVSS